MLDTIEINQFALMEHVCIDLAAGLTVLSGETGAGKSILIDAVNFALGTRAAVECIREGANKAEVTLYCNVKHHPDIQNWLSRFELDDEEESCILRRTLTRDGRSRAYINGSPVPLQRLRELRPLFIDIHGQHASHRLLTPAEHGKQLDTYGNHQHECAQLNYAYKRWRELVSQIEACTLQEDQRKARQEALSQMIAALDEAGVEHLDWEKLVRQQKRFAQRESLRQSGAALSHLLNNDHSENISQLLNQAHNHLDLLIKIDTEFKPMRALLKEATILVSEVSEELQRKLEGNDAIEPADGAMVEAQMSELFTLARKYKTRPEQLNHILTEARDELQQLNAQHETLDALQQAKARAESHYHECAKQLSQRRHAASKRLSAIVTRYCQQLGMPNAQFSVALTSHQHRIASDGYDAIHFEIATNRGACLRALNKVASGGELSRISLAIELANQAKKCCPVLIFDEVDTGIGGGVAEMIGQCLRRLGAHVQVLCVTHLAQVAACGHHHLKISKPTRHQQIQTTVTPLQDAARRDEIARMLGGLKITDTTKAHANELMMLGQADEATANNTHAGSETITQET